jgi:hypothetical protein
MRHMSIAAALVAASAPALAEDAPGRSTLGLDATPLMEEVEHLRINAAPDYWAFAPFLRPRQSPDGAGAAAVAVAVNGLSGLPEAADAPMATEVALIEDDPAGAPPGSPPDVDAVAALADRALAASPAGNRPVEAWRPAADDLEGLTSLRRLLTGNEETAEDAAIVVFDQGALTGGESRPHAAVVGAYDPAAGRVLLLDPDLDRYVPYWVSDVKLAEAMLAAGGGVVMIGAGEGG